MKQNHFNQDENCIYDTNRINLAINNQFKSNYCFTSNINTELIEVESGDLMKVNLLYHQGTCLRL
jgi:hypothetical protein